MPWKEVNIEQLARDWGIDPGEVRAKQNLMLIISKTRQVKGITQRELGRIVGVSQGRIAQIESGAGTAKVTFDVLFRILAALGKNCRVTVHSGKREPASRKHKTGARTAA